MQALQGERQQVQHPHAPPPNGVTLATILMVCFIAEHNLPFAIIDHMVELCKVMFPDSVIAQDLCMKRTKCTDVAKRMGMCVTNALVLKIRKHKFSVIVDESTDVSTRKCLCVVVKYYDTDTNTIKTDTLELIDMYSNDEESVGSTGEGLYARLMKTLNTHHIPPENFIGFAADGASNIMGEHNSMCSRLRTTFPGITIMKCICHSIHLCASEAVKSLPRHCEDLIRNIFTHFSHSAKRKHQFKQAQLFLELKPHKMLHPCQSRWLSLHQAVARVLEQWEALKLYFTQIETEERLKTVEYIVKDLKDPAVFLYLNFLNYILPLCNRVNLLFQRDTPTIHLLYEQVRTFYVTLVRGFCRRELVDRADLTKFNPDLPSNHMPLNQIYLGSAVHGLLQTNEYSNNKSMVEHVQLRCREFMIQMCQQIQKRFDLDSRLWYMASFLEPAKILRSTTRDVMPSLHDFAKLVPRLYCGDLQTLDNEWRALDSATLPQDITTHDCSETAFFVKLGQVTDNDGNYVFKNLAHFALMILALPTSNSAAERLFSKINLTKTDYRNRLQIPAVQALTVVSEAVKAQGCCFKFQPSNDMIDALRRT